MGPDSSHVAPSAITNFISIVFKICGSSKSNNLSFDQNHLIKNPICFANISAPKNRSKMFEYSTRAYGSQFSGEKNGLKIRYLVAKILSKKVVSFFLGHPVGWGKIEWGIVEGGVK